MTRASQISLNTGKNIQRSLNLATTAATAMAASVIASLTAAIDKAQDFSFAIGQMAMKTGSSTEMFSKLAYNAKLAGVPMDNLKQAMERMARTSYAAQSGNKEASAAYGLLGISVKQLQGPLKDSGNLFVAVAKGLDKYKDSTAKTGIEQKLLGRSGADLAPLIKQVATGFDTASAQATLFGVVVGDKTAAQALKLHQSLEQLESISMGLAVRLLTGVSPALEDAADKIVNFVTSSDGMKTVEHIASDLSKTVYALGDAFEFLTQHTTAVKRTLEGIGLLQGASIFLPMITGAAKAGNGIESIGLVALKMVSRASGITALGSAFSPLIKGAVTGETSLLKMVRAFGVLETAQYGCKRAFEALSGSMLANPYVLLGAALIGVAAGFYKISEAAMANEVDGGKWSDVWNAGILGMKENLNDFKKVLDLVTGDYADFSARKFQYSSFNELVNQAGQKRRGGVTDDQYRMIHAGDLKPTMSETAEKPDAPALPAIQKDKIDHLKLKMDELAASAKAAMDTLRDAGKSVDFERANEITKEYNKTVIELEAALKAQGKTLSEHDKAAIQSSIATRINSLSQADYRDKMQKTTEEIMGQTSAQELLNAAIGKVAETVRNAQVAAYSAKQDQGKSDEWKNANVEMRAARDAAYRNQLGSGDTSADKASLIGLKDQLATQLRLNAAILGGKEARDEANRANDEAAIRKNFSDRGDTDTDAMNAQIAASRELLSLKNQEAALQRAASMSPALVYQEETRAIQEASKAARDAGQAINYMQEAAANKQAWNSYLESIDKTTLAVGDASDGVKLFFNQMGRDTESAAEQVHTVLEGAFNSLNDTLEKLISGQKASFAEMFRSISKDLAKVALQKVESGVSSSIMSALGMGDKKPNVPPATSSLQITANTLLQNILTAIQTANGGVAGAGGTSGSGGILGAAASASGASSGVTSIASALGPFVSMIPGMGAFGGHLALGGDVTAGMSYDVGEMGRERFTPNQNGTITPNKSMGTVINMPIDARGANDPAQTELAIHRAMGQYAPHLASGTQRSMNEKQLRSPMSKR